MAEKKPTDQHREFARHLAAGMTAKDAALAAGFAENTSKTTAHKWVGFKREDSLYPELWDLVHEIRKTAEKQADSVASLQELLEFLTGVVRANIDQTTRFDGFGSSVKSFEEMGDAVKYVQEFEFKRGQGTKIKTISKMDAVEKLLKYHGAYAKDNEQSKPEVNINTFDTLPDDIKEQILKHMNDKSESES